MKCQVLMLERRSGIGGRRVYWGVGFVFCLIGEVGIGLKFLTNVLCACSNRSGYGGQGFLYLGASFGVGRERVGWAPQFKICI